MTSSLQPNDSTKFGYQPIDLDFSEEMPVEAENKASVSERFAQWRENHPSMIKAGKYTLLAVGITALLGGGVLLYLHFGAGGISHSGFANLGHQIGSLASRGWKHLTALWGHKISVADLTYGVIGTAAGGLLGYKGVSMVEACLQKKRESKASAFDPGAWAREQLQETIEGEKAYRPRGNSLDSSSGSKATESAPQRRESF